MGKSKTPRPLRHFYLHPDGDWIHFRVFIWKTKDDMFASTRCKEKNFEAIHQGGERYVKHKGRWTFCGELGQLHFYEDSARCGIIVHECCHAAHAYFRFRSWFQPVVVKDPKRNKSRASVSDREEAFCWIMGNLFREFQFRWQRCLGNGKCAPSWFSVVKFRRHRWTDPSKRRKVRP